MLKKTYHLVKTRLLSGKEKVQDAVDSKEGYFGSDHYKLVTLVEGDPNAPFSIATTPRCRGGCHSIRWIAPLYLWSFPLSQEFLQLIYCRWRWQAFNLDPFTYAYRPDNTKRIAGIRSDNIFISGCHSTTSEQGKLWQIFEQAENEDNTKCTI